MELAPVARHRPYFRREVIVGRRVIFEWTRNGRWPGYPIPGDVTVIGGFEFATDEAAAAFDLTAVRDRFSGATRQEAEAWVKAQVEADRREEAATARWKESSSERSGSS